MSALMSSCAFFSNVPVNTGFSVGAGVASPVAPGVADASCAFPASVASFPLSFFVKDNAHNPITITPQVIPKITFFCFNFSFIILSLIPILS